MNDDTYHLAINGQRTGPFPLAQVREMWRTGALPPQTLFWRPGEPEWLPISRLTASFGDTSPLPPQPPQQIAPIWPTPYFVVAPQTSGLAIGSFVCGLLTFLLFFTCIPAVILGHMAFSRIKGSAGRLGGRGLATAGLVMGYLGCGLMGLTLLGVLAGLFLPMANGFHEQSRSERDLRKAKQIGLAIVAYENDHDGTTPPTLDALFPTYLQDRSLLLASLGSGEQLPGFDYLLPNTKVATLRPHAVMLCSRLVANRHQQVCVYADGSVELGGGDPSEEEAASPTQHP